MPALPGVAHWYASCHWGQCFHALCRDDEQVSLYRLHISLKVLHDSQVNEGIHSTELLAAFDTSKGLFLGMSADVALIVLGPLE